MPPLESTAMLAVPWMMLLAVPLPIETAGVGAPVAPRLAEENPAMVYATRFATQSVPELARGDVYVTVAFAVCPAVTFAGLPVTAPAYAVLTIGSLVTPGAARTT